MSNTKSTSEMMMLKLPTTTLNFVENNPKIAKMIGTIIVKRQEIVEVLKEADAILADPDAWETLIEDGSKEELELFLEEIRNAIGEDKIIFKKGLNEEEIQELMDQARVNTEVEV